MIRCLTLVDIWLFHSYKLNIHIANRISESLPDIGRLVICGLPRTGSTLLYNLLACDPNCRSPLYTDMNVDPVPPVPRSNLEEHERRAKKRELIEQARQQLAGRVDTVSAGHPSFDIEEDYPLFYQAGIVRYFTLTCSEKQVEPDTWLYDQTNKDFVYAYHKTFLRMLNSVDQPSSYWLLKTPTHTLFLDIEFRHYPNALMIMTHRRLDEVLPSYCSLT